MTRMVFAACLSVVLLLAACAVAPASGAEWNCPGYSSCDACTSAGQDETPTQPCGWCMATWSCMRGDVNGPAAPIVCAGSRVAPGSDARSTWQWSSCDLANSCNGLHCDKVHTCQRHTTTPDGVGDVTTSYECRLSTALIIGVSVAGSGLCMLILVCVIAYRRRQAAAKQGFLSTQPYLSETHVPGYYETAYHQQQ